MGNTEYTLPSGAKFLVNLAPFEDATDLKDAIIKEVRGTGIQIPDKALQVDIETWKDDRELMSMFLDKVVSLAGSKDVRRCLFKCFERTSYNSVRVTKDLFDDVKIGEQAREDYYHMCMKVMEVNLKPFFKTISSALKALAPKAPSSLG